MARWYSRPVKGSLEAKEPTEWHSKQPSFSSAAVPMDRAGVDDRLMAAKSKTDTEWFRAMPHTVVGHLAQLRKK